MQEERNPVFKGYINLFFKDFINALPLSLCCNQATSFVWQLS